MNTSLTTLVVFAFVFGGAMAGIILRSVLPERYFSADAKDVFRLGLGLISTMNAIVLGLLISTAKSSYDERRTEVTRMAADAIMLDRSLALFGDETQGARRALRELLGASISAIQEMRGSTAESNSSGPQDEAATFYRMVRKLSPRDDAQRAIKSEVLRLSLELGQIRALGLARQRSSIPKPFLIVLVFWLAILFVGFGFFAPPNPTVISLLCICAVIVSAAIFLIIDMDQPLTGFMEISLEPLRNAMMQLGN